MLAINSKNIRFLAHLGARGVLGQAVYDFLRDGNEAYVVSADMARASGFDRIKASFPDRLMNVGIAEQNMLGIAAGLASGGIPVVATSWATFASTRAMDQVRNFMGYMQANVKLIGMDSGLTASKFGYTHSSTPDIAVMRAIPNVQIFSPCDGLELYIDIYEALKMKKPVYIRLTGRKMMPMIHKEWQADLPSTAARTIRGGGDMGIISCGVVMDNVIKAADILEEKGISVTVVDMHSIEPLDRAAIDKLLNLLMIAVVEDHVKAGGLYSAVSEYISAIRIKNKPVLLPICLPNEYIASGRQEWAEQQCGMNADGIVVKVMEAMQAGV